MFYVKGKSKCFPQVLVLVEHINETSSYCFCSCHSYHQKKPLITTIIFSLSQTATLRKFRYCECVRRIAVYIFFMFLSKSPFAVWYCKYTVNFLNYKIFNKKIGGDFSFLQPNLHLLHPSAAIPFGVPNARLTVYCRYITFFLHYVIASALGLPAPQRYKPYPELATPNAKN